MAAPASYNNPVFWRFESAPTIDSGAGLTTATVGLTDSVVVFTALGQCGLQTVSQLAVAISRGRSYLAAVAALTLQGT